MIINQTGVSTPFTFAGTGDEYVIAGIITNLSDPSATVITAAQVGNHVTNAGQISSFGSGSAIEFYSGGTVVNSGVIVGAVYSAERLVYTNTTTGSHVGFILVSQSAESLGSTITNRGSLTLADAAGGLSHPAGAVISLSDSADTVINSGRISGDVLLGGGNDVYDGRFGSVAGVVNGGLGDDLYYLTQATSIVDDGGYDTVNARGSVTLAAGIEKLVISGFGNFSGVGNSLANLMIGNGSANTMNGGAGDDTLQGGNGADILKGNTGNDSLEGQAGNDRLLGSYGNDTLLGGDGDDSLMGDTGADQLFGGIGADWLDGGVGGDSLDGGEGNDTLIGGSFGSDTMTGGLGADVFAFQKASDSFATAAADTITDFVQGEDRIDLSALIAGDFLFVGGAAFSDSQASVRTVVQVDKTLVLIDLDHNGYADMQVFLTGVYSLVAEDFLL